MNVFDLFATLSLDSSAYRDGLADAEGEARSASGRIGSALGGVARVAGAATVAAVGAAAAGVGAITTQAVNAYGEYEQLSGGIARLFGDASSQVMENAANAYADVGMTANSYMQSVTTFSAALINSVEGDTQRAAEIANIAMQDLADNANTFGTMTVDELANIYSALARGQFMTLDSLNLGYAGSQEGMIQLINDAGILEERIESLDGIGLDTMLLAIHQVQENMQLTGTTANEAEGTIQGSINQLKAAWGNLVTGLADDNADLGTLIDNVVSSAEAAAHNVIPAISRALGGIGQLVQEISPIIQAELPTMVNDLLPAVLTAATSLVSSLITALPSIFGAITDTMPVLFGELIPAIIDTLPLLVEAALQLVLGLADALSQAAPTLIPAAVQAVLTIVESLTSPDNLMLLVNAALQLASGIAQGILMSLPEIIGTLPVILNNLTTGILGMIPQIIASAVQVVGEVIQAAMGAVYESGGALIESGLAVTTNMIDNIQNALSGLVDIFGNIWSYIEQGFAGMNISLPHIDLPHFTLSGQFSLDPPSVPSLSVQWYAKAMDTPYLLTSPTIFGAGANGLRGGGEAGDELVVGWSQLKRELGGNNTPYEIHVHNYIGGDEIDEFVLSSNQINNKISGGRG